MRVEVPCDGAHWSHVYSSVRTRARLVQLLHPHLLDGSNSAVDGSCRLLRPPRVALPANQFQISAQVLGRLCPAPDRLQCKFRRRKVRLRRLQDELEGTCQAPAGWRTSYGGWPHYEGTISSTTQQVDLRRWYPALASPRCRSKAPLQASTVAGSKSSPRRNTTPCGHGSRSRAPRGDRPEAARPARALAAASDTAPRAAR